MSFPTRRVGAFLASQSQELERIWRLARAQARAEVFPGLLDDLVGRFFRRAGELLAAGAEPEEVWSGLVGLVRWPPSLAPAELTREWAVVAEVVSAACESVDAHPDAATWLTRAVAAAEAGTVALAADPKRAPPGVVTALVFSSVAPAKQPGEPTQPG